MSQQLPRARLLTDSPKDLEKKPHQLVSNPLLKDFTLRLISQLYLQRVAPDGTLSRYWEVERGGEKAFSVRLMIRLIENVDCNCSKLTTNLR
jgi:hypothetical protein